VSQRNYALDLLRGLTIALMIIVNNPGDWKEMFVILRHAEWHGFLGADLVFPLFLFVSGYAAAMRIHRRYEPIAVAGPHCASALTLNEADQPAYYIPLLRRAAILFLIGLFLNAWPFGILPGTEFSWEKLRVFGVLQRIAICVLVGGVLLRRFTSVRALVSVIILISVVYEICMRVPLVQTADGVFGRSFELADNFARFVDTRVVPDAMLYKVQKVPFDPEGIFTSLTAVITFLLGGISFRLRQLRENASENLVVRALFSKIGAALACALLGVLALSIEPINKNLWTLPYVLFTGAAAMLLLVALERVDFSAHGFWSRVAQPFADMGKNPLVIYVLSGVVGKALALYKMPSGMSLKAIIFNAMRVASVSPKLTSLLYSVVLLMSLAVLARAMRRLPVKV